MLEEDPAVTHPDTLQMYMLLSEMHLTFAPRDRLTRGFNSSVNARATMPLVRNELRTQVTRSFEGFLRPSCVKSLCSS